MRKKKRPKLERPRSEWPLPVIVTPDEPEEDSNEFKSAANKLLGENRGELGIDQLQELLVFESMEYYIHKKGLATNTDA